MIQEMTYEEFIKNYKNLSLWNKVVQALLDKENIHYQSFSRFPLGGNIVYQVDNEFVLKLYAPFNSREYLIELGVLERTDWSSIHIRVPQIKRHGLFDGWYFILMTIVPGELLIDVWHDFTKEDRINVALQLGRLIKEMHSLNVEVYESLDCSFESWIMDQKKQVVSHHEKTGLPSSLVDGVSQYVSSFQSTNESVLLTGEYTPYNLMVNQVDGKWTLTGLIDFADSFIGEAAYDLLGPILFTFYKECGLTHAFFEGYDLKFNDVLRERLMQLCLLHRFSNLPNYMEGEIKLIDVESLDSLSKRFFHTNSCK